MLAKFGTNSGGITWWSKFELIQVLKWIQIQYSWKDNSSYKLYTLGPLCLWQCFCVLFRHLCVFFWNGIINVVVLTPVDPSQTIGLPFNSPNCKHCPNWLWPPLVCFHHPLRTKLFDLISLSKHFRCRTLQSSVSLQSEPPTHTYFIPALCTLTDMKKLKQGSWFKLKVIFCLFFRHWSY